MKKGIIEIIVGSIIIIISLSFLLFNQRDILLPHKYIGEEIDILLPYKYIGEEIDGIVVVSDGKKYGYYDLNKNKLIIDLKYDLPQSTIINNEVNLTNLKYKNGMFPFVGEKNKEQVLGLKDSNEKTVVDSSYHSIGIYGKDLILVSDEKYTFINSKGQKLIDKKYDMIESIGDENELFIVIENSKYGILNSNMKEIAEPIYDNIIFMKDSDNYFFKLEKEKNRQFVIYDKKTENISNLSIETDVEINNYSENIITYKKDGNYYNYDLQTKKTKEIGKYSSVGKYYNGLAIVKDTNEKIGFIDKTGKVIIPMKYSEEATEPFIKYPLTVVLDNNNCKVINNKGEIVLDNNYKFISIVNSKRFIVTSDKASLVDEKGKKLSEEYDYMEEINNTDKYIITIKRINGQNYYGLIDNNGKVVAKNEYLSIKVYDNNIILENKDNTYTAKKI